MKFQKPTKGEGWVAFGIAALAALASWLLYNLPAFINSIGYDSWDMIK